MLLYGDAAAAALHAAAGEARRRGAAGYDTAAVLLGLVRGADPVTRSVTADRPQLTADAVRAALGAPTADPEPGRPPAPVSSPEFRRVRRGRVEAAGEVADISRIAEESLREIRGVVGGYRSASLAGEPAGARSLLNAAGVSCTVTGDEDAAFLPVPVQAVLGWAVRESVTNVLRHSRATTCSITVRVDGGSAELRVVNDGAAEPADPSWGSGLTGLAERLSAAGGRLSATSGDGRFELAATLPVAVPA
ncbi:sensor histidine kinase [Modestobacter sp. I12A-02662]|uniref:sensor histidine kinase n=1 Tax=Modestobacter sp. I12A-02662 TaxID=1730496 RepID=UPI0034DFD533